MKGKIVILFVFVGFLAGNGQIKLPKYEFRAVWVATVNNIDWPSKPGLTNDQLKQEALTILDRQASLGMNAIILQIRPASDAFYKSELEPWSKYLTGTPGKGPEDNFDPLEFWIDQCHLRGMELHAWLNPFRITQNYLDPIGGNHIAFRHPEWVVKYGNSLYFDPGVPAVWEYLSKVVSDIVTRYDVDAIHFDDYFYPYPTNEEFPDNESFALYNRGFARKDISEWRRSNVDSLIMKLGKEIKKNKSWVKFGVSPFGVWRNKYQDSEGSETTGGTNNYDDLYANVLVWLKNGWIDYVIPQLYWQVGHPSVDFATLANWWNQHSYGRQIYIGHAAYKSETNSTVREWSLPDELPKQIRILRSIEGIGGSAYFSSKHFERNLMGFQDSLQNYFYARPAIVPPMQWIDNNPPKQVEHVRKSGLMVKWKPEKCKDELNEPRFYVVYLNEVGKEFNPQNSSFILSVQKESECTFKSSNKIKKLYEFRVSALDRSNNESEPSKPLILKL